MKLSNSNVKVDRMVKEVAHSITEAFLLLDVL